LIEVVVDPRASGDMGMKIRAGNQLEGKMKHIGKGPAGRAVLPRVAADLGISAEITEPAAAPLQLKAATPVHANIRTSVVILTLERFMVLPA
jgi:molybdopterin-binding protein